MTLKTLCCALAAIIASSALAPAAFANRGYTQQQQQACQGDAIRLCGPVIPDHARIHSCLRHHRTHLSHACRAII